MDRQLLLWLVLLVLFLIAEIATTSLVSIWFVGGCAAAALTTFVTDEIWIQILVFLAVSVVLVLCLRPIAARLTRKTETPSGAQRLIGKEAVVTEPIDNLAAKGAVQVNGAYWTARTESNDTKIEKGTVVKVLRIDGVKLIVEKAVS